MVKVSVAMNRFGNQKDGSLRREFMDMIPDRKHASPTLGIVPAGVRPFNRISRIILTHLRHNLALAGKMGAR
jgi:hypothetical protein